MRAASKCAHFQKKKPAGARPPASCKKKIKMFSNPFSRAFKTRTTADAVQKYREKFHPKPYAIEYRPLYIAAVGFGFICNAITLSACAYALFKLVTPALPAWAGVGIGLVIAAAVEALKRATAERVAVTHLRDGSLSALALVSLAIIALSTFAAYWGAENAIIDAHGSAQVVRSDSLTAHHVATIAAAREAIATASAQKRADGSLPPSARRQIERAQKQIERAQARIEQIELATDERNARIEADHNARATGRGAAFGLVALLAEVALLICIYYANYYQFRAVVEAIDSAAHTTTTPHTTPNPTLANGTPDARRPIGFHKPAAGEKVCRHCGEAFTPRTTWQRYCSEACRVAAWEARSGKKLVGKQLALRNHLQKLHTPRE